MKISEQQFRDDQGQRDELFKVLQMPCVVNALQIIEERAKPRRLVEPRPNAHQDTLTSQHYYKILGVQSAVDHLRRLTEPNDPKEQDPDELAETPYFHSLPKEMQEALKKQVQERLK